MVYNYVYWLIVFFSVFITTFLVTLQPPVDWWNSVKPLTGLCILHAHAHLCELAGVGTNGDQLIKKRFIAPVEVTNSTNSTDDL